MKFTVTFKNPDTLQVALDDAAAAKSRDIQGLSDREREALQEATREELGELCAKWFEYSEYVRIEIDTDAKTATVLPVKR